MKSINKSYIKEHYLSAKGNILLKYKDHLDNIEIENIILSLYDDSESLSESIYRFVNDIEIRPVCKTCGGHVNFNGYSFQNHCCRKCTSNDPEIKKRNAESVSKALKQAYIERGNEIKEKRGKTLGLENGKSSPFSKQEVQDKCKATVKEHYGVDNVFCLDKFHVKAKDSARNKSIKIWKERGYDIEYDNDNVIIKNGCKVHGDISMSMSMFSNRMKEERRDIMCICPICNPPKSGISSIEVKIKEILESLNIKYYYHDRYQIKPKELDFYLPDYKIGIECNGMYWHSVNWQSVYNEESTLTHFNKRKLCNDNGIQLLYFWEHDINYRDEQIKGILRKLTDKTTKINNVEIKEISDEDTSLFIKLNSVKHYQNLGNINLGVFNNDILIGVISIKDNQILHIVDKIGFDIDKKIVLNYIRNHYPNSKYLNIELDYENKKYWLKYFKEIKEDKNSFFYNRLEGKYVSEDRTDRENIYECYDSGVCILELK